MSYVEQVIEAIAKVIRHDGLDSTGNPTRMTDTALAVLLIEDPETGTLYSVTVEEA